MKIALGSDSLNDKWDISREIFTWNEKSEVDLIDLRK